MKKLILSLSLIATSALVLSDDGLDKASNDVAYVFSKAFGDTSVSYKSDTFKTGLVESIEKGYFSLTYNLYDPKTGVRTKFATSDLTHNIFENDLVSVVKQHDTKTLDAYGTYTEYKQDLLNYKINKLII